MPASLPAFALRASLVLFVLMAVACKREAPPVVATPPPSKQEAVAVENGAISQAPVTPEPAPPPPPKKNGGAIDWSPVELKSGTAWISCDLDYSRLGDGTPLLGLDRESISLVLLGCADRGVMRLRYQGRVSSDFAALVERVTRVAETLEIRKRVLDIDSAGGLVEDAIRAGDFIAGTRWTVWVREGSLCHSACVFVLAAGDVRRIAGRVGVHRIIRMSSTVTTRAELNAELQLVHERVRNYLERNGANVAVADLMRAVPNRSLRVLSDEELLRYGLDGVNPAQDDLDRLRLMRECGEDFVTRRDAFARAFDRQCREIAELDAINACGLALRKNFGFPDSTCPAESPLSEFDLAQAEPTQAPVDATAPEATPEGTQAEPTPDAPSAETPGAPR
jgi:membrane-bound ClpP family serine protease